jgi:hypothetical protein
MNVLESVLKYMDIDSRRALGALPRRLDPTLISNLESKLTRDTPLVYLPHTRTIFNFNSKCDGYLRIYRPMILDMELDGLYIFNLYDQDWSYELISDRGDVYCQTMSSPWCTELKLKIVKDLDESEDSTSPS